MSPFQLVTKSFTCPGSIRQTLRPWNVFVIDFAHHIVFDYAPGSAHPRRRSPCGTRCLPPLAPPLAPRMSLAKLMVERVLQQRAGEELGRRRRDLLGQPRELTPSTRPDV
jgi:hypothetical protein